MDGAEEEDEEDEEGKREGKGGKDKKRRRAVEIIENLFQDDKNSLAKLFVPFPFARADVPSAARSFFFFFFLPFRKRELARVCLI